MKNTNTRHAFQRRKIGLSRLSFVFLVTIFLVNRPVLKNLFSQDRPREISFGLNARELRQKAVEYAQKKYMPIEIGTHYSNRGQIAVSAIWNHQPTAEFKFRTGLLRSDIKKAISEFGQDGFRLIHFTGTGKGGEERYSGIWIREEGQQLYARYGVPLEELKKMNEKFMLDGYSILRLATFEEKGQLKFTAIWDNPSAGPRILDHHLSLKNLRKMIDKKMKDGFRLVQVIPYPMRRNYYFSVIWEPSRGQKQEIAYNVTRLQIRKMEKNKLARNFHPQSIAAYRGGRKDRHIIIWEENDAAASKKKPKGKLPAGKS